MTSNTHADKSAGEQNDHLLTNIDIIDAQHKKIIELVHKLQELKTIKIDFTVVMTVLNELYEYVNFHFETEENLMRSAGVTDIENHVQQHDFFRSKLNEFREKKRTKSDFLNNLDYELMLRFLRDWLIMHTYILGSLYIIPVAAHIAATGQAPNDKGNQ